MQVTFPEKAGALQTFLQTMSPEFNVTMFHYRTSGNKASSALLGIQVPPHLEDAYESLQDVLTPTEYAFESLDEDTQGLFHEFVS